MSGLKLNKDKTEIFNIGRGGSNGLCKEYLKLIKSHVKVLGISITGGRKKLLDINYDPIFEKMKSVMNIWSKRKLSLQGKVCILKTLVISKLIYSVSFLPSPEGARIQEMQKLMYEFIWDGKAERIPRKVLVGNYNDGGYRIPDLYTQIRAIKGAWVVKLIELEGRWKDHIVKLLPFNSPKYFSRCNIRFTDLPEKPPRHSIWSEKIGRAHV